MKNSDHDSNNRSGGGLTVALLLFFVLILGLGMGLLGFVAGRATAPSPSSEPAVVAITETSPGITEELANGGDVTIAQENPTEPPPTVEPEPTTTPVPNVEEPTANPPATPTAEPIVYPTLPPGVSPIEDADLATLYEIWEVIADQFDGDLPPSKEVIESAIRGSIETLDDRYTRYVSPEVARRMREDMQGSVEGIGAFVRENDDGLFEIVRPIDGQPAALAGLKAGDVLVAVDGESVIGINFDEVILLVRGPKDTQVTLTIVRDGEPEPLEFTVTRTRFEVPVVEFQMLPDEITGGVPVAYIRLTEFNRNAEEKLLQALNELLPQAPVGVVFDLRDNPGGFLDQSVAVADVFLPDGIVLFERNIRGLDQTFVTGDGDIAEAIPLVVLVNAGSASASEIVAGAIQDRGRAILIGETTFGKGSVQQIYPLTDGGELRVTIARWYTPNNNTIDDIGITPDIEIETPETLGGVDDGQLRRAVDFLINGQ